MKKAIYLLAIGTMAISTTSCKKDIYGCTDPTALNYSDKATATDNSCIHETKDQNVFTEEFYLSFSGSTPDGYYDPSFNYESGDVVIVEILSDDFEGVDYWSPLPYTMANAVIWNEYSEQTGDIWVYTDYISTGSNFNYSGNYTIKFRAALIKKSAIQKNPDLKNKTIAEIKKLIL